MPLSKASETDFQFPIFAFIKDGENGGYPHRESLRDHRKWHFEDNIYPDMELIDCSGRRWIVRHAYVIPLPRVLKWWHIGPLKPPVRSDLELEIEEQGSIGFPALVDRVCSARYEARQRTLSKGREAESEEYIEERIAEARTAKDAEELYDLECYYRGFAY